MSKLRAFLAASLIAGAFVTSTGCGGQPNYAVRSPPPPPVSEPVLAPRGEVWIPGHWANVNWRWVWHGGHYETARPGQVYFPGRWRQHGDQYVWVGGEWRSQATGMVQR
jgi:hypothetical protein